MLKQLLTLLRKGDTIGLSIGCETDANSVAGQIVQPARFRINVLPKLFTLDGDAGPDRKALNTPLTITGTADELDSPAFVEAITRFTTSATDLRHTLDEAVAAHQTAGSARASRAAADAPSAAPGAPSRQAAKPAAKPSAKPSTKPMSAAGKAAIAKDAAARRAKVKAAEAAWLERQRKAISSNPPAKRSHHAPKPGSPAWLERQRKKGLPVESSAVPEPSNSLAQTAAQTVTGTPPPLPPVSAEVHEAPAAPEGTERHGEVPAAGTIGEPSAPSAPSDAAETAPEVAAGSARASRAVAGAPPATPRAPSPEEAPAEAPATAAETPGDQSTLDRPATAVEATPSLL